VKGQDDAAGAFGGGQVDLEPLREGVVGLSQYVCGLPCTALPELYDWVELLAAVGRFSARLTSGENVWRCRR
jgi:hypothetical protein